MREVEGLVTLRSFRVIALAIIAVLTLGGCQALAITVAGIGASTGLTHTAGSISSRTFTAPDLQVRRATLTALEKMGVKIEGTTRNQLTETIRASLAGRSIEVELETLNTSTTRITATAQRGVFVYDGATAREIVAQTETAMAEMALPKTAKAPARNSSALADSVAGSTPIRR